MTKRCVNCTEPAAYRLEREKDQIVHYACGPHVASVLSTLGGGAAHNRVLLSGLAETDP